MRTLMAGVAASPPLEIALRPSRLLIVALALGHALALAAPWLSGLPPWLAVMLSAAVVFSAAWQLRQWRQGARRLRWQAGVLRLEFASGRVLEGEAQPGWVLPGFIALNLLPAGGRRLHSLLLLADSANPEALRQLRAVLRHPPRKEDRI
jgi:hypothetical protein